MVRLCGIKFLFPVAGLRPTAEEMQVEMIHRLSAEAPNIERKFISFEVLFRRNTLRGIDDRRDHIVMILPKVRDGLNVLLRNDDDMDRGFGMDVGEGEDMLILRDDRRWYLATSDTAEYAVHRGHI